MEEQKSGDPQPQSGWPPPGGPPAVAQEPQDAGSPGQPGWGQGGQGPGLGSPAPWTRPARTESTAIWALVFAALTYFVPIVIPALLALILAVVARRRIRQAAGALGGAGVATTAMVVAVIGVLFNLVVVALVLTGGFVMSWNIGDSDPTTVTVAPDAVPATTLAPGTATATTLAPGTATATTLTPAAPDATTPPGGSTSAQSLQVGDCIRDTIPDQVVSVEVVDCGTPHAAEVFANVDVPSGTFPGDQQIDATADTRCEEEFLYFVGVPYESSVFYMDIVTPTEETWAQGDHVITCALVTEDASPLTGSMRGAGR